MYLYSALLYLLNKVLNCRCWKVQSSAHKLFYFFVYFFIRCTDQMKRPEDGRCDKEVWKWYLWNDKMRSRCRSGCKHKRSIRDSENITSVQNIITSKEATELKWSVKTTVDGQEHLLTALSTLTTRLPNFGWYLVTSLRSVRRQVTLVTVGCWLYFILVLVFCEQI